MRVIKDRDTFKATRITGPAHNLLGLELSENELGDVVVEALATADDATGIDENDLLSSVHLGVAEANAEYGTSYYVRRVLYIPSDTPELSAYVELAKAIIAEAQRDVAQG